MEGRIRGNLKYIKEYKSCEFQPLLEPLDLGEGVETPIWLLLPFPALHSFIEAYQLFGKIFNASLHFSNA